MQYGNDIWKGFGAIGLEIICGESVWKKASIRRFRSWFGVDPHLCDILWDKLSKNGCLACAGVYPRKKHLLWALWFLRSYNVEEIHAGHLGVNEQTLRKWAWFYTKGILELDKEVVSSIFFRSKLYCN